MKQLLPPIKVKRYECPLFISLKDTLLGAKSEFLTCQAAPIRMQMKEPGVMHLNRPETLTTSVVALNVGTALPTDPC